ncbi:hypothetical protein MMC07_001462 [Pseudocyphellaria aurata]|nr:hypothetical protein [Pseudocyphellaria aurata]
MTALPTKICVFCSTGNGNSPAHLEAARSLARAMHANSIELVYGAGTSGMMGELAKTLVALSGPDSVHGIIPRGILRYERPGATVDEIEPPTGILRRYLAKLGLGGPPPQRDTSALLRESEYGRLTIVQDMQTRKKMMAKEVMAGGPGSGFIGLSGGFGTMDELMEVVTWNQLGVHNTGVCLFNVEGFWDGILAWMDHAIRTDFIRSEAHGIVVGKTTPDECLEWLRAYRPAGHGMNQTLEDA